MKKKGDHLEDISEGRDAFEILREPLDRELLVAPEEHEEGVALGRHVGLLVPMITRRIGRQKWRNCWTLDGNGH